MQWTTRSCSVAASATVAGVLTLALILPAKSEDQGGAASAPKVSKFAPAEDLVGQAEQYMKTIQEDTANADQYKDSKEEIAKTSNTLAVIVLALGLHDEDNKYKAAAPAILKAAQEVAAAANFDAAKKAAEKLEAAAGSAKAKGDLKWTKVASLEQLMKQVPLVNTKLKRNVKGAATEVEGQGDGRPVRRDRGDRPGKPGQHRGGEGDDARVGRPVAEVLQARLRDAAAAVNAGIHAGNRKATDKAMGKLAESCDDCHNVFHKEAEKEKGKAE